MTPPARKAVLKECVQPTVGEQAPTVQRAFEKTATFMPITPEIIDVRAPTTKEMPDSNPMAKYMHGNTTTTKRMQSLYSAVRKEVAPRVMALYSSRRLVFCFAESLVLVAPAVEVTSSWTAATLASRKSENAIPMMPVMMTRAGAGRDDPATMPPSTQVPAARTVMARDSGQRKIRAGRPVATSPPPAPLDFGVGVGCKLRDVQYKTSFPSPKKT